MITRKIGNILRGNATPFQIVTASVLGSLIGFVPGFHQAPGLLLLWIALLVLINANLFLAGVIGVAAKLLALLLTPVSFAAGRVLLEGPTRGVFSALVNGPVSAWFGLEYYVVTGGALLGLVFGLVVGLVLVVLLRRTWRKLAALESDSETFKAWSSKGWVKVSAWIFIGGVKGKQSYEVLLARRFGNPVRLLGLVLVVLSAILGYFAVQFLDSTIVTVALRGALERANGATVDLQQVDVSLRDGRVAITGLALADPDRLDTNLFAAKSIEAKLSTDDLLRRRAVVDSVVVTGGTQGDRRAIPGVRIGLAPEEPAGEWKWPDMQSLDQILANADLWKERLQTAKRWLDKMKSDQPAPGTDGAATPTQPAAPGEPAAPTYEEILRERVRLLGYAEVRDESIVEKAPRLLIRLIAAGEVQAAALPGDPLDIRAENLSTEPHLVPQAPTVRIASKSGRLKTSVAAPAGAAPQLEFLLTGLSVDALVAQIKESSRPALQGGTLDLAANGALGMLDLNLPITLTLHDTALAIGGKPTPLKQLAVPVVVRGTLTNPAIRADGKALQDALVAAGKKELSNRLQAELEKKLSGSGGTSGQGSEDLKKAAGGLLDGLLAPKEKKPATPPTP